ncbi:MAG: hypothetical protein LUC88_10340, partial [Prevotella sp.]|nr:hypothetical protein [Prevotella sp.]
KYGEEIESVKFSEDSEWLKVGEDGISIEVFSNKSGIPEEVLHEIQNISIYVNFDGVREHTSDTLRLSEEAINKIQNALQHEYIGAGRDSFNIHVITPIQYLMAELKDELSNARTVDQKLGKYSVYVTKVESSEKAIDEILSEASTILLEKSDYATFLTYFKAYSDRPVYKDVENKLNGLNKAQEVAANELQLKNDANKKKAQLQSLDCTPQTLQAVKKWYDGLDVDSCQ